MLYPGKEFTAISNKKAKFQNIIQKDWHESGLQQDKHFNQQTGKTICKDINIKNKYEF